MAIVTADIGGTFTDLLMLGRDGRLHIDKRLSTRPDYGQAVAAGILHLLARAERGPEVVEEVRHGTTVATNAILERRGASTALITTLGFRDVLEIGRLRTPKLYDITWSKPLPLVLRRHRFEIDERMAADGGELRPVDPAQVVALAHKLQAANISSVAVCLLNAHVNDAHELVVRQILNEQCPDLDVSISSEVLREMREFERTSTTVANAYVRPVLRAYLQNLEQKFSESGLRCPVFVMQSNGGVLNLKDTIRRPIYAVESGPAAGIIGARRLCLSVGVGDAITFDMGGTTAKASIIENGRIEYSPEFEIGGEISRNSRLIKGSGYLIRTPAIDVAEVGAGGGSIARLDAAGGLRVGPISAGASPGPACYALGGTEPTVTDANLVLGFLNPGGLAGGAVQLDIERARAAIELNIGEQLGISCEHAALGIHDIANANMARAIRSVSTERGRDIRKFKLIAFGGNGPIHAAPLARMFDMPGIVIPPNSGVFSAMGLVFAEKEHHLVYTLPGSRILLDASVIKEQLPRFRKIALAEIGADEASLLEAEWFADLRYLGQGHDLRIRLIESDGVADVRKRFGDEHRLQYGHDFAGGQIEVMNLRVVVRVHSDDAVRPDITPAGRTNGEAGSAAGTRRCFFGKPFQWQETQILPSRYVLGDDTRKGPIIIEEYDATIVVPPDFQIGLDGDGNVHLNRIEQE